MKKNIFILILASILTSSCKKEHLYSCDSVIDEWVIENYDELKQLNRESLLSLRSNSYRRAAYRTLSIQKKKDIWKDKYLELEKLDWTIQEWLHIQKIYSLILLDEEVSILNMDHIENNDSLLIQIYRWEEYARENLKWTKKQIYAICYTPEIVLNRQGDLYYNIDSDVEVLTRSEYGFGCSCSQISSYCDILEHEGPDYTYCKTPNGGSCVPSEGCGLFWLFTCDGMCLGLYV